jgi:ribose/xylose/arabinose/galactoside ABC-type transport system permease subunit
MRPLLQNPVARPYVLLVVILLILVAFGGNRVLAPAIAYSVLQQFSVLGPVALALGITMMLRHFDLSVAGMLGAAGCLAVIFGGDAPLPGLLVAIAFGMASGAFLGAVIVRLRLSSIGVTLGGLLVLNGFAYVVTGNREIGFPRLDVTRFVDFAYLNAFSPRFLAALVLFAIAGAIMSWTRLGRDVLACGSDPRAAKTAGVSVEWIVVGAFTVSGAMTAMAGGLLSYSLAAASPSGLADVLVPAAAAAIIGGVSLGGGRGHPVGIAGGVLVLCLLRTGLTALGVPPFIHDIATGGVLLVVGLLDGGDLSRRIAEAARLFAKREV